MYKSLNNALSYLLHEDEYFSNNDLLDLFVYVQYKRNENSQ